MSWKTLRKQSSKLNLLECYDVLYGLADAFSPQSYLEIGVREGASLCCVLAKEKAIVKFALLCLADGRHRLNNDVIDHIAQSFSVRKDLRLYLFDNWSYLGGRGAHERVTDLLERGFKTQNYMIYDGDSKATVPEFFAEHEDKVDLAFIDGDHTVEGAVADLENVVDHSRIIVMHDLFHPEWGSLEKVFVEFTRRHNLPYVILGRDVMGTGVAFNLW